MKRNEFKNEYEYRSAHERRQQHWSDEERRLRKERRHPLENELNEKLVPLLPRSFKP